jgi:hypothetical protein
MTTKRRVPTIPETIQLGNCQVTMVSKSDTNQLHGSVFDYYSIPIKSVVTLVPSFAKPDLRRSLLPALGQLAQIGGELVKGKLFLIGKNLAEHSRRSASVERPCRAARRLSLAISPPPPRLSCTDAHEKAIIAALRATPDQISREL